MQYRVHRMNIGKEDIVVELERFLNGLGGDVVSVLPTITPTFKPMGATAKVDSLLIVERVG